MITYCGYNNTSDKELTLKLSVRYDALAGRDSVVFYWKSCDEFCKKTPNYFPEDVVFSNKTYQPLLNFVAQVDPHVIKESKVVGSHQKSKFPADFDGPLVGVGHAWYVEGTCAQGHRIPISSFNVYVPYDGKIFKVSKFSFLCSRQLPRMSHFSYPRDEWVKVYISHRLPLNAFPAGIASDGETLYVSRAEHYNGEYDVNDEVPGYVTPSDMYLHITWDQLEFIYDGNDGFEMLVVENQDLFEWVVDSRGNVPRNAVIAGRGKFARLYYIGRKITGSDPSVGEDHNDAPINLPDNRVGYTQLVGKVDGDNMCVAWNGSEYYYQKYEVLVQRKRFSPENSQRLCHNAIIILTMGMSDQVDQLNLPAQLKDFCKVTGYKVD